ncbi:IS607 family transposase [Candidatus Poribacteria bacterium]|nr:IS607 family transposase [Candidatus Poribacteria bacterium]
MERHYTPKEAGILLGISVGHLQRLDREGKIKCIRTTGGRRRIPESEIKRILGEKRPHALALYARVSSHEQKQKGDLKRQIETIKANFPIDEYSAVYEITDVSSGLNDKRKGLIQLISLAEEEKISDIVITFKDRLTRFSYNYLEQFFSFLGVKIHVLNYDDKETLEQELVKDLLSIVTSFSGKLYGMRSHKKKRIIEHVKEALKT